MMGVVTGKRWAVGSRTCNQPQVLEEELCVQSSVTKFPHLATGLRQRQIFTEHLQTAPCLYTASARFMHLNAVDLPVHCVTSCPMPCPALDDLSGHHLTPLG